MDDLLDRADGFHKLLGRIWVLGEDTSAFLGGTDGSLGGEIKQHVYRNRDWDTEHLFERLGAFDCSSHRFLLFLEGLASPDVRPDEDAQRRFVLKANSSLRACGLELRETGAAEGYPMFGAAPLGSGTPGKPKNLIFASPQKPDLRFRDAVSNDIEIVKDADKVLVYDRPIGAAGLKWKDLQAWWAETKEIQDPERAKGSLYRRLRASLPKASPPQQLLFRSFFEIYRQGVPDLPALLPEVWLHWDPKTVAERGAQALARFRMDFLLLLAGGVRVVVEVDGQHHYAHAGHADPARYAAMAAADRELKLAGYEVYRFGAVELEEASGRETVREFFARLFKRHGIKP